MDPYTGQTYTLGRDLTGDAAFGAQLDLEGMRERARRLERKATAEERRAMSEARALVHVAEPAAQAARLGQRELERRKRRRSAAKRARRHNRA